VFFYFKFVINSEISHFILSCVNNSRKFIFVSIITKKGINFLKILWFLGEGNSGSFEFNRTVSKIWPKNYSTEKSNPIELCNDQLLGHMWLVLGTNMPKIDMLSSIDSREKLVTFFTCIRVIHYVNICLVAFCCY
jgi:hypothetical protein